MSRSGELPGRTRHRVAMRGNGPIRKSRRTLRHGRPPPCVTGLANCQPGRKRGVVLVA